MIYAGILGPKTAIGYTIDAMIFCPDPLPRWQALLPGAVSIVSRLSSVGFFLLESLQTEAQ